MEDLLLLKNQFCFQLYAASRKSIRAYTPFLKELDLTYPQYIVLLVLWEHDPQPMMLKEIGELLFLDSGTLSPLLRNMVKSGLITKKSQEDDERSLDIQLTEKGRALKEPAREIPAKVIQTLAETTPDPLNLEEADLIMKYLSRFNEME